MRNRNFDQPSASSSLPHRTRLILNGHKPNNDERKLINVITQHGYGLTHDSNGWHVWGLESSHESLESAWNELVTIHDTQAVNTARAGL